MVVNLANVGITLSLSDQFLLTAVPKLIGSFLRIPYTFAVPRFGGRAWTTLSASLLLIPCVLLAAVVPSGWLAHQDHATQLGSFIGYSFALPLLIKNTFPAFLAHHSFIATYLAGLSFVGALVGSLARPLVGWVSDRLGGAG